MVIDPEKVKLILERFAVVSNNLLMNVGIGIQKIIRPAKEVITASRRKKEGRVSNNA